MILSSGETAYNARWQRRRKVFLMRNPLCCYCKDIGKTEASTTVDHKVPHRGDAELFWNEDNWQALCTTHHQSAKQQEEYRGFTSEVSADGWPIDHKHPANTGRL